MKIFCSRQVWPAFLFVFHHSLLRFLIPLSPVGNCWYRRWLLKTLEKLRLIIQYLFPGQLPIYKTSRKILRLWSSLKLMFSIFRSCFSEIIIINCCSSWIEKENKFLKLKMEQCGKVVVNKGRRFSRVIYCKEDMRLKN